MKVLCVPEAIKMEALLSHPALSVRGFWSFVSSSPIILM
jgi:hypothetical protein